MFYAKEITEAGLEDFRACVEALTAKLLELKAKHKAVEAGKGSGSVENFKDKEQCMRALNREIRMLKHSNKKEHDALLAKNDFAWHQLKKVESYYTDKLKNKKMKVEHLNEAMEKLQRKLLELQASVNEKDETIAKLKAGHELDMRRHTQEAQKANEKIEQLRIDNEELCSLAKEKDDTIDELKSDLVKLQMDVRNCTLEKSGFS